MRPKIDDNGLVREMTEEEYTEYLRQIDEDEESETNDERTENLE